MRKSKTSAPRHPFPYLLLAKTPPNRLRSSVSSFSKHFQRTLIQLQNGARILFFPQKNQVWLQQGPNSTPLTIRTLSLLVHHHHVQIQHVAPSLVEFASDSKTPPVLSNIGGSSYTDIVYSTPSKAKSLVASSNLPGWFPTLA